MFFLFFKVQILNVFTMCWYLMLQKNIWTDPQFQLWCIFFLQFHYWQNFGGKHVSI